MFKKVLSPNTIKASDSQFIGYPVNKQQFRMTLRVEGDKLKQSIRIGKSRRDDLISSRGGGGDQLPEKKSSKL